MDLLAGLEKLIFAVFRLPVSWRRFIRYSIVGLAATIADFSVYFTLTRTIAWLGHNYLIANVCSFAVGSVVGYFLNRSWTFEQGRNFVWRQYLKFLLMNILTLIILQFCFYIFVEQLGLYDLVAKVLLLAISIACNFTLNSLWTFRRP